MDLDASSALDIPRIRERVARLSGGPDRPASRSSRRLARKFCYAFNQPPSMSAVQTSSLVVHHMGEELSAGEIGGAVRSPMRYSST
jgi:hypothetical protein